jgi:hypothetical protein
MLSVICIRPNSFLGLKAKLVIHIKIAKDLYNAALARAT